MGGLLVNDNVIAGMAIYLSVSKNKVKFPLIKASIEYKPVTKEGGSAPPSRPKGAGNTPKI